LQNSSTPFSSRLSKLLLISLVVALVVPLSGCPDPEPEQRIYVLAIDAFRADYFEEAETPTLDALAENGVFYQEAKVSAPSQTRVNFVTLPTGTHADRHGVVGASYRSPDFAHRSTDFPDYDGAQEDLPVPTIFEVLDREKGWETAYLAMKGYELVGARGADYQVHGEEYIPEHIWEERYETEVNGSWDQAVEYKQEMDDHLYDVLIDVVEQRDPQFLLANFAGLDYIGHQHGAEEDYLDSITHVDSLIGDFVEYLEGEGLLEYSTIIIPSDHGMTNIRNPENTIMDGGFDEPDFPELDDKGIEHAAYSNGGLAFSLYVEDSNRLSETAEWLQEQDFAEYIHSEHDISGLDGTLSEINLNHPERAPDFFVSVHPNYTVAFESHGQHGSLRDSDMYVPMIYSGAGVAEGVEVEGRAAAENVDLAPTVLEMLGLDPDVHLETQGKVLQEVVN